MARFLSTLEPKSWCEILRRLKRVWKRLMTYDCNRSPSTLSDGRLITVLLVASMLPMMSSRGPLRQPSLA